MPDPRLGPRVRADLARIYRHSEDRGGRQQADRYTREIEAVLGLIFDNPGMTRLRTEFDPPIRVHPHGAHVILYHDGPPVRLLRILHHRQGWLSRLR